MTTNRDLALQVEHLTRENNELCADPRRGPPGRDGPPGRNFDPITDFVVFKVGGVAYRAVSHDPQRHEFTLAKI